MIDDEKKNEDKAQELETLDDDFDFDDLDDTEIEDESISEFDDLSEDWDEFDEDTEESAVTEASNREKKGSPLKKKSNLIIILIAVLVGGYIIINQLGSGNRNTAPQSFDDSFEIAGEEVPSATPSVTPEDSAEIVQDTPMDNSDSFFEIDAEPQLADLSGSDEAAFEETANILTPLPNEILEEQDSSANVQKEDSAPEEIAFMEEASALIENTASELQAAEEAVLSFDETEANSETETTEVTFEAAPAEETIDPLIAENEQIKKQLDLANSQISSLKSTVASLKSEIQNLKSAPVVEKSVSKPVAVKQATPVKTQKTYNSAPVKTVKWTLKSAQPGQAMISPEGSAEIRKITQGDNVPGLGRITSIAQENGRWVVRGTQNSVSQ